MKKAIFLLLALALVAGFGFANGDGEAEASAAPMVDVVEEGATAYFADYPEGGYIIKEDAFLAKVEAGEDMFVLDIRQPDVYAEGHISGAVNVPWGPELAAKMNMIPQTGQVYLYCYTGQTAGQTVAVFNAAGIPVKSIRYGFNRGISTVDGFEESIDAVAVAMPQMTYDIDPAMQAAADDYFGDFGAAPFKNNIIASADAVAILAAGDDSVQFVDIRQADAFAEGHIEGAVNIPYAAGMQSAFSDLPADKKLIVNCYSGQTAGQTVGILRLLGYDAASLKHGMGTGKTGDTGYANEGFELVM